MNVKKLLVHEPCIFSSYSAVSHDVGGTSLRELASPKIFPPFQPMDIRQNDYNMSRKHYSACPCWQLQYKILSFLKPSTRCCLYTKPTITCIHASLNIGISLPTRKTRFSKNVHLKIMQGGFIRDNTIFDCQGIQVPQRDRNQLLNTERHICHWLDVDLYF